jgi:hypothetical protein
LSLPEIESGFPGYLFRNLVLTELPRFIWMIHKLASFYFRKIMYVCMYICKYIYILIQGCEFFVTWYKLFCDFERFASWNFRRRKGALNFPIYSAEISWYKIKFSSMRELRIWSVRYVAGLVVREVFAFILKGQGSWRALLPSYSRVSRSVDNHRHRDTASHSRRTK